MGPQRKSRFWRICRIYFRRFRIACWLVLLGLLGTLVYLNQVGLPGFVKRPLIENLRARGVELQFSRLRMRWYEGLVAENVRFGRADQRLGPELKLGEVQVRINPRALAKLHLQIDSLLLREGRLVWPITETNQPLRQLTVENVQTDLRFLPDDQWALDNFTAEFAGVRIRLSGAITNASAIPDWKFLQGGQRATADVWQTRLRRLADMIESIRFPAPPELMFEVEGDARDLQSFQARLQLNAPGADTPWGTVSHGSFAAKLLPANSNGLSRAEISLEAADANTRWGAITNLQLSIHLASFAGDSNLVTGDLFLVAKQLETKWGRASNPRLAAQWNHTMNNSIPLDATGQLEGEQLETQWADAGKFLLTARLAPAPQTEPLLPAVPDPSLAWWTNLEPFQIDWACRVADLRSPKLEADELTFGGNWCPPELTVTNLHAKLYQGEIDVSAALDVSTRFLDARVSSLMDPQKLSPLLTEGGRRWLASYSWNEPPEVTSAISLILPSWTNRQPDWRAEVQPKLRLDGHFKINHGGGYQQVAFTTAESHFGYSNMVWHLPDLTATRPEGRVAADYVSDDRTKDYYWRLDSTIDPMILRPFFQINQQQVFELVTLTQPPVIAAEMWGRWHDRERIGFRGHVSLTNFTIRGESIGAIQTGFQYTNRYLLLTNPRVQRGEQHASADTFAIDFDARKIYLTNGFGVADIGVVTRAIGPKVARVMEPYQFGAPPIAHVHGVIPMGNQEDADLHFEVEGSLFHWWKFYLPHIGGDVHWVGQSLTLSDVHADFYGGSAKGSAVFNFTPKHGGVDYQFAMTAANTRLQSLMAALAPRTNHLEGLLNGTLRITHANSADWRQMTGYGSVELRDGLIWDIPIFGLFTPVLNGISPGLGNSRASAATGTFIITNGVIRSDDLEIRSPALRLEYRGTVDLQGQVNARVEAELLRDVWGVGPIISTVFWPVTKMLEYKVTGSLGQPKSEPIFLLPRIMLFPFRGLKEAAPEDANPYPPKGAPFRSTSPP